MPLNRANRERKGMGEVATPDRGLVPAVPYQPPDTDPWTAMKHKYVKPIFDTLDTFKNAYDGLVNTLGGVPTARPRRR